MSKGIFLASITVSLWALYDVLSRYFALQWQVDPFLLITFSSLSGALVMLVVAGPGRLGKDTVRDPYTWAYSFFEMMENVLGVYAFTLITTTETNFLIRFSVIIALLAAWIFLKRAPKRMDFIAIIFILIGCVIMTVSIEPEIRFVALFFVFFSALFRALATFVSELHPQSNRAITIKDRCRITGYVLAVTSVLFLSLAVALGLLKAYAPTSHSPHVDAFVFLLPSLESLWHVPTIWAGAFMGIFLMSLYTLLYFRATQLAKSEVFLAVAAFSPVMTFIIEYAGSLFGLLDITSIDTLDYIGAACIMFGAVFLLVGRHVPLKNLNV